MADDHVLICQGLRKTLEREFGIDAALNTLLKFFEITIPARTAKTVHNLIENILTSNQVQLEKNEFLVLVLNFLT